MIARGLSVFGLVVPAQIRDALGAYCRLLLRWGERINLTAARSVASLVNDHLPDSFAIATRLGEGASSDLIDVGSGGGLPAIPLALLHAAGRFTLVEATAKKVAFLRAAARELGVDGRLEVQHRRLAIGESPHGFDVATSRAMVAPAEWLPMGAGLVRSGGRVFCLGSERLAGPVVGLELVQESSYRTHRWVAELKRST